MPKRGNAQTNASARQPVEREKHIPCGFAKELIAEDAVATAPRIVQFEGQLRQLMPRRPPAGGVAQSLFLRCSDLVEPESQFDLQPIVVSRGYRMSVIDLWWVELVLAGHDARLSSQPPAGSLV